VVVGIVDDAELLDGRFAFVTSQVLTGNIASLAPDSVVTLGEGDKQAAARLAARLRGEVGAPDEVLSWKELSPMMAQMLAMFDIAPIIFFIIIFFAVALGIVNTMLMATFERTRELGLMRALGMRPGKVVSMVMWEAVLLAAVGAVAGLALGMPMVWYWIENGMNMGVFMTEEATWDLEGIAFDPILWPSITWMDVVRSVLVVSIMTSLSGLWPAVRAARLQPTEALRHE
jgi:ABC-type antimicrobial peptide transport system permease subunit